MLLNCGIREDKILKITWTVRKSNQSILKEINPEYSLEELILTVKCLPTMQETRFQSLGREDPLEKAMATHSRILAWKIPWTEEPGRLQSMGSQRVRHN